MASSMFSVKAKFFSAGMLGLGLAMIYNQSPSVAAAALLSSGALYIATEPVVSEQNSTKHNKQKPERARSHESVTSSKTLSVLSSEIASTHSSNTPLITSYQTSSVASSKILFITDKKLLDLFHQQGTRLDEMMKENKNLQKENRLQAETVGTLSRDNAEKGDEIERLKAQLAAYKQSGQTAVAPSTNTKVIAPSTNDVLSELDFLDPLEIAPIGAENTAPVDDIQSEVGSPGLPSTASSVTELVVAGNNVLSQATNSEPILTVVAQTGETEDESLSDKVMAIAEAKFSEALLKENPELAARLVASRKDISEKPMVVRTLGSGTIGMVSTVAFGNDGNESSQKVAKIFEPDFEAMHKQCPDLNEMADMCVDCLFSITKELQFLQHVRSNNAFAPNEGFKHIVGLEGYAEYVDSTKPGKIERHLYLEKCDGTIEGLIKSGVKLNDRDFLSMLKQMMLGIHVMHKAGLIHCDMKGPNVLVKQEREGRTYKIADLGSVVEQKKLHGGVYSDCFEGTNAFCAPERDPEYGPWECTPKTDIYATYVTWLEARKVISDGAPDGVKMCMEDRWAEIDTVVQNDKNFAPLKTCVARDPNNRPSVEAILRTINIHPKFKNLR